MLARKALAGTAAAPKVYVEDVFSTYLYTGSGANKTITNNIDISGEGGLVWIKERGAVGTNYHSFFDTERGTGKALYSNGTSGTDTKTDTLTTFTSSGFSLGVDAAATTVNVNNANYVSWTFRKAKKFFDVVTYTGTGTARTINHNLGSAPGLIIVKGTNIVENWIVYHRSLGATKYIQLNTTGAAGVYSAAWNDTEPTSTQFTVGTFNAVNESGYNYVAYLFAHDAGGFGAAGDQSVIKCGSYTGNGVDTGPSVDLGWEPQWVLVKNATSSASWYLSDNLRGFTVSSTDPINGLQPNTTSAEATYASPKITNTGFGVLGTSASFNELNSTYIYIAIRRGPMKTPEAGTEVFAIDTAGATAPSPPLWTSGFVTDFALHRIVNTTNSTRAVSRLTGEGELFTNLTNAEGTDVDLHWDYMDGFWNGSTVNSSQYAWMFRRAPGFFDVVCYTGTGSATTISHNLGVAPELMIVKRRNTTNAWAVYANNDNTDYLVLNTTAATVDDNTYWNDTSPTSSVFSVGTNNATNASGSTYVAYLFASVSGVSKVGSYTGNGSSVTVTTGFQPRFILVKRTDSTGNWIVSDSARGLIAGNDPYLLLNSSAAEDTDEDWVDVSSTGFTVNETTAANANVNTATYIYLAIA